MSIKEKLTHVKWCSDNIPVIVVKRNDARLYLSKRELLELYSEINEFVLYYDEDFREPVLDRTDDNYQFELDV